MTRRRTILATTLLTGGLTLAGLAIAPTPAQAGGPATVADPSAALDAEGWVDGQDEYPCLDDVTCLYIEDCELDENQQPIYPNRNGVTHYPPGTYRYRDEIPTETPDPTPTPTPTTPPTTPPTTTPTQPPTGGSGTGGTGSSGSGGSGGGTGTGSDTGTGGSGTGGNGTGTTADGSGVVGPAADPLGGPGAAAPVAAGAPSAPAAPTLTVSGDRVKVSWVASPNAELEQVTGYLVRFTGQAAIELDATTFAHTFSDLPAGSYRAAVWAVNAAGESLGSPPSEPVVVGVDPTTVAGTVAVAGDLTPGATVTLTGSGFAPRIQGFAVELHSDPVALATVDTDDAGGFTTQVTIPASVPVGEHQVVVLFDGTQVSTSPVTVAAAGVATAAASDTAAGGAGDVARTGAADPVPDHAGLVLLGVLATAGGAALLGQGVLGRRRRRLRFAGGVRPGLPEPA